MTATEIGAVPDARRGPRGDGGIRETTKGRQTMKPVMLATDGSPTAEQAAESAIELAGLLHTELAVVTVWNIPYSAVGFGPIVPMDGDLAKLSEEQARRVNADAAARAEEAGVETRSLVLRGFP